MSQNSFINSSLNPEIHNIMDAISATDRAIIQLSDGDFISQDFKEAMTDSKNIDVLEEIKTVAIVTGLNKLEGRKINLLRAFRNLIPSEDQDA